jgi:hydroxymethylpyrimidine pyrophosphatase-like HAD family hydrolase
MTFKVLALDYDGTIARDGVLPPGVRAAIAAARDRGVTVALVTGRILDDLRRVAGDLRFVDCVVAENGAVISFPESGRSLTLAAPVPPSLVGDLRRRGVAVDVGRSVIEADAGAAPHALAAIRTLELPYAILFNRGRLMILPSGVNKASGLREALRTWRVTPHNAIAIGDAENDHDLLEACELGVAVGEPGAPGARQSRPRVRRLHARHLPALSAARRPAARDRGDGRDAPHGSASGRRWSRGAPRPMLYGRRWPGCRSATRQSCPGRTWRAVRAPAFASPPA